ncbi:MAG: 50S ribosomal protein L32 [Bacteroidales bacterium]|jgi:large subunit ribosomal protein L32|nr:50S ribosomal protein L32 [Bacteroidales bacterium]
MAHPKRKISKQRRDKRRTHYKAVAPTLSTCSKTGTVHQRHRAYLVDGNLYYKGKLVIDSEADMA